MGPTVGKMTGSCRCSWWRRSRMGLDILEEQGPVADARPRQRLSAAAWLAFPRDHPTAWAVTWTVLLLAMILAPQRVLPDEHTMSLTRYIPYFDLTVHF